jgi:hypothetical protein
MPQGGARRRPQGGARRPHWGKDDKKGAKNAHAGTPPCAKKAQGGISFHHEMDLKAQSPRSSLMELDKIEFSRIRYIGGNKDVELGYGPVGTPIRFTEDEVKNLEKCLELMGGVPTECVSTCVVPVSNGYHVVITCEGGFISARQRQNGDDRKSRRVWRKAEVNG